MLRDLKVILDRPENDYLTSENFYQTAALIRRKQFIWSDGHGQSKHYNLTVKFQEYFENLFGAFGDSFVVNNHFGFCGILPNTALPTMKALDTIFLLILAKLYDSEARKACIENGRAHPSPALLIDTYVELTGREKPKLSDTLAAFKRLASSGIIVLGEKDEISDLPKITILPTISMVLNEKYIVHLEKFTSKEELVIENKLDHEKQQKNLDEVAVND